MLARVVRGALRDVDRGVSGDWDCVSLRRLVTAGRLIEPTVVLAHTVGTVDKGPQGAERRRFECLRLNHRRLSRRRSGGVPSYCRVTGQREDERVQHEYDQSRDDQEASWTAAQQR